MKKPHSNKLVFLFVVVIASYCGLQAQGGDPVTWKNTVKKISADTYEVHLAATVSAPWHLFSQVQPADAIPQPTVIKFTRNPLLVFVGKTKELGKMEAHKDATLGSIDHRYAGRLEFVQVVKLKSTKAKTNVSCTVSYQVCNEEQCLPPRTMEVNLPMK